MHPIIQTDFSNFTPSQVCTLITQKYFNSLPEQIAVLHQVFIESNLFSIAEDFLPFLFLRLGDQIEALMRFEQQSLFPYISNKGSNREPADPQLSFAYVHRLHNRMIWYLRELEHFVNNVIDLRSKKTLQFINHLKALEHTVLDWNYLVQEILAKQQQKKVVQL